MRVRVLGCSGAVAQGCNTTAFLVDQDILIDAGTGVGALGCEAMAAVTDVFLTHAHLDHVAYLPLMVDSTAHARVHQPLRVHALPDTLAALHRHMFNDHIWPDFTRLPTAEAPLVTFHPLATGDVCTVRGRLIEALPAEHTVPTVGYAVRCADGDGPWWIYTGDTERNPRVWQRLNQMDVHSLVIETAFSNRERELARRSKHLSPDVLAEELQALDEHRRFPIYITHTKPSETETVMREIAEFAHASSARGAPARDIRWLRAGDVFEV